MAVPMITLGFIACVLWTVYGEMLEDPYISVSKLRLCYFHAIKYSYCSSVVWKNPQSLQIDW